MKKPRTARNILVFLLAFLAIGAIAGGGGLVISPSGEALGMPVSMLAHSPFTDFLVPGIILLVVFGIFPCILVYALLRKPGSHIAEKLNLFGDMHWSWTYTIYNGFALIVWIQAEMVFLGSVHWLHTFYMGYAVAIILVALMPNVRNIYKMP